MIYHRCPFFLIELEDLTVLSETTPPVISQARTLTQPVERQALSGVVNGGGTYNPY
jgi:hypothetical protein